MLRYSKGLWFRMSSANGPIPPPGWRLFRSSVLRHRIHIPPTIASTPIFDTHDPSPSTLMSSAQDTEIPISRTPPKALFPPRRPITHLCTPPSPKDRTVKGTAPSSSLPISSNQAHDTALFDPEVFVDASEQGIGLILGTHWLAWTFIADSPDIRRSFKGPGRRVDTSWSELVAVELGVRTVIAAGVHSATVRMRSDNTSVVEALQGWSWGKKKKEKEGLTSVLMQIMDLCHRHGLVIEPEWVPTADNPADGPSRGDYPPTDKLLSSAPLLPVHLHRIITLVKRDQGGTLNL